MEETARLIASVSYLAERCQRRERSPRLPFAFYCTSRPFPLTPSIFKRPLTAARWNREQHMEAFPTGQPDARPISTPVPAGQKGNDSQILTQALGFMLHVSPRCVDLRPPGSSSVGIVPVGLIRSFLNGYDKKLKTQPSCFIDLLFPK